MIFPRSLQQVAVLIVDLIAWPVNRALAEIDLSDLTNDDDSHSLRDESSPIDALDFSDIGDDE